MPIAFYLPGDVPIYTFSVLLGLSAMVGLAGVAWQASQEDLRQHLDAGLWSLVGGLVGGRLSFVAVNWVYFQDSLSEIFAIYLGGISWPGALAGGLLALVFVSLAARLSFAHLIVAMIPLLASLTVGAWLSCWLAGCAYGPPANSWWGIPSRDEWGMVAVRWPTQLLGALLALGLFALLDFAKKRLSPPSKVASLVVFALSLKMWLLSLLRVDPMPGWRGMRLDSWSALAFTLAAGLFLAFITLRDLIERGKG